MIKFLTIRRQLPEYDLVQNYDFDYDTEEMIISYDYYYTDSDEPYYLKPTKYFKKNIHETVILMARLREHPYATYVNFNEIVNLANYYMSLP